MKSSSLLLFAAVIMGCANGEVNVIDANDKVVGQCSAKLYWHWHGAQDSVDYLLHVCAKEQVEKGFRISDESVLYGDYALPAPPQDMSWNKKIALQEFKDGNISEKKYGYILAAIEYEYWVTKQRAEQHFEAGEIDENEYDQVLLEAKDRFHGK